MNVDASNDEESAEWEKPWSTQKMRDKSLCWSLAGDAGLLLQLQKFSDTLVNKATDTNKNMNNLILDAKALNSRINNSVNSFLMLANCQFVENRVYDEEIIEEVGGPGKTDEQDKNKEQRETELVPRISLALELGLKVIEQAFEKHEIVDSESEDEGGQSCAALPVLEPKDPYLCRPLPFIIGSEKFLQDDRIGLVDIFSEDDGEESEKESLSESYKSVTVEKKPVAFSENSDVESDSSSEWKEYKPEVIPTPQKDQWEKQDNFESSDEEGNMFGNEPPPEQNILNSNQVLTDELNKKFLASRKADDNSDTIHPKHKEEVTGDVNAKADTKDNFGNLEKTEYDHEDENDLFTKNSNLFSSETSGGLFDGGVEHEDLFSDLIRNEISKKSHVKEKAPKVQTSKNKTDKRMSIFDDDDDDDLFDEVASISSQDKTLKSKSIDDGATENSISTPKKSLPAGARSLFGNAVTPLTAAIKARCIVDTESENVDDWSDSDKVKTTSGVGKSSNSGVSTNGGWIDGTSGSVTSSLSSASLFAEEPDASDIFANDSIKRLPRSVGDVSLFDDDVGIGDDDDLFGSAAISKGGSFTSLKPSQNRTTVSEKSKNENPTPTLDQRTSTSSSSSNHEAQNIVSSVTEMKRNAPKKLSLFDDDDDEDIFSEPSSKPKLLTKSMDVGKKTSIFDSESDKLLETKHDDTSTFSLFKTEFETSKMPIGKPPVPTPRKPCDLKQEKDDTNKVDESKPITLPKVTNSRNSSLNRMLSDENPLNKDGVLEQKPKEVDEIPSSTVVQSTKDDVKATDEVNVLACVTKVRARIPAKRRLPTRKSRHEDKFNSSLFLENAEQTKVDNVDSAMATNSSEEVVTLPEDCKDSNSAGVVSPATKSTNGTLVPSVTSPSTEEDDIFSLSDSFLVPVVKSHQNKEPESKKPAADESADTKKGMDPFAEDPLFLGSSDAPPSHKQVSSKNAKHFQSSDKKKENSLMGSPKKKGGSNNDLFDDDSDSDDLFASASSWRTKQASSSSKKSQSSKQTPASLFSNSDDDDSDIFGGTNSKA